MQSSQSGISGSFRSGVRSVHCTTKTINYLAAGASNNSTLKFMKMTTLVSFASHLHPRRRSARKLRSRLAMSTLLMTVAALVGSGGGGQRCAAQPNFPPPPVGGYASDEYTFSIGVAQIQVDPN